MNNALAAILGGLSGGARSLGASRMAVEQDQRNNDQKLAMMDRQEQMRRALIAEKEAQDARDNEELTKALTSMGILQPGQTATKQTAPYYQSQQANERAAAAQEAQGKRLEATMGGQMQRLQAQIDANKGVNDARIQQLLASAAAGNARAMEILAKSGQGGGQPVDNRKVLPATMQKQLDEVGDVYSLIRDAKGGMDSPEAKGAVGLKYNIINTLTPKSMEGRVQSMMDGGKGDMVRARLGNLWSTIGKLRSGGAITDAEFSRLQPFLPSTDDDYEKAVTKLTELDRAYTDIIDRRLGAWGEQYKVPSRDRYIGAPTQKKYNPANPFAR